MSYEGRRDIYAKDLPPEKLEELLKRGYTVSPNSGRLRKRIRKSGKSTLKRKFEDSARTFVKILLVAVFILSLIIIFREMNSTPIKSQNAKQGFQR